MQVSTSQGPKGPSFPVPSTPKHRSRKSAKSTCVFLLQGEEFEGSLAFGCRLVPSGYMQIMRGVAGSYLRLHGLIPKKLSYEYWVLGARCFWRCWHSGKSFTWLRWLNIDIMVQPACIPRICHKQYKRGENQAKENQMDKENGKQNGHPKALLFLGFSTVMQYSPSAEHRMPPSHAYGQAPVQKRRRFYSILLGLYTDIAPKMENRK